MRFAALVCAIFVAYAFPAHAMEKPTKTLCEPGVLKRTIAVFETDGGKSALNQITATSNLCYRERVTLGGLLGNELTNEATCICPIQSEPDKAAKEEQLLKSTGCEDGQRQPTVTIEINRKITGCTSDRIEISKCVADPEEAYKQACESGANLPYIAATDARSITIAEAGASRSMPSLGLVSGNDTLMKALTASGISEEKAQEIIANDRQTGIDYIRAIAGGNADEAKIKADVLGINPDLSKEASVVSVIRAEQDKNDPFAGKPFHETGAYQSTATGFSTASGESTVAGESHEIAGALPTQCGKPGYAGNFMLAESGCNRQTTNALNPYVGGAHHYLCSTWESDAIQAGYPQYRDCSYRHNVEVSSLVVNSRYAQHERVYGESCVSAGVTASSCMHNIHVFGEGGFRNMLHALQQNPDAPASSLCGTAVSIEACRSNQAIFNNGGTVRGVFAELDRRLVGGSVVTTYARSGASVPSGASVSAFGGFSGGLMQASVHNSQSPFGQTNVVADIAIPLTNGLRQQYYPRQSPFQQPAQAPQPGVQQPVQLTPQQPAAPAESKNLPQAVATLNIQPKTLAVGAPFLVTWTSVGMRGTDACELTAGDKVISRKPSGAVSVKMQTASQTTYTLTCISLGGEKIEKREVVTVQ